MKLKLIFLALITSGLSFAQGNGALQLSGSGNYVSGTEMNNLGTSDFTIEAWIYVEGKTGRANKIVSKGCTDVGTPKDAGYSLRVGYGSRNEIDFAVHGASGGFYSVKYNNIKDDKWYHIAAVRKSTTLLLFINGQLVGEKDTKTVLNVDTDMPFSIGALDKNGISHTNEYFYGTLDEVRIWKVARTEKQINGMMSCTINWAEEGLLAVYNFDAKEGTQVKDGSGNGNHCELIGGGKRVKAEMVFSCQEMEVIEEIEEIDLGSDFKETIGIELDSKMKTVSFTGVEESFTFRLHDSSGKFLMSNVYEPGDKISLEGLPVGDYYLNVPEDISKDLFKFTVE